MHLDIDHSSGNVTSMLLTQDDIDELKKIHKEVSGEELSDAEAREIGKRLLRLYEILAQPLPR